MSTELPIVWPADNLIPAVIQDASSHDVLMVGFMNPEALEATRKTGLVHFWSRSRHKLWKKGETSGHVQHVRDIFVNCELNSLLIEVEQDGAVCHDGYPTCYYRRLGDDNTLEIVRDRSFDPADVYGDGAGDAGLIRQWWGAYAFLRDNDLTSVSGTSKRLRDTGTSLLPRIADELRELAGVLDGTHVHTTPHEDVLLEGSQASYWLASELIRTGVGIDDVRPDRAMDLDSGDALSPGTVAKLLKSEAATIGEEPMTASQAHALFALVANAALSLGRSPMDLIRKDLDELRSRDCLERYFAR